MFGRVPPHNLEAEMAVLGSMMLGDRGAVERATEILGREDFYREAHAHIFDAMVTLSERDEPVDTITLRNELQKRGILDQVGGIAYLLQLGEIEFTTANIGYYARIVQEKAILRRLIEAASNIAGLAYGEVEEVSELVDRAERIVFEVARKRDSQGFTPLRPLLNEAFEKIDTLYHEKGITTGVDTGFSDLNYMTSGLQDGDLVILAARPSMGKCVRWDTLIDNPLTGERLTAREYVARKIPAVAHLAPGQCRVATTAVGDWVDSGVQPCFRVTTRTGRAVDVTENHPFLAAGGWLPLYDLKPGLRIAVPRRLPVFGADESTPPELVRLLAYCVSGRARYGKALEFHTANVPVVNDFHSLVRRNFTEYTVRDEGERVRALRMLADGTHRLKDWLTGEGVWGKDATERGFPASAWRWTRERLTLFLDALFDCDATLADGTRTFAAASAMLAGDARHALTRFGVVATVEKRDAEWAVTFPEAAWREARAGDGGDAGDPENDIYRDEIVSIDPLGEHPVYDLTVADGANFVAADIFVHNTSLAVGIGQNACLKAHKSVAVFSLEMSKEQLVQRMICSEARVDAHRMRTGFLHDEDWDRVAMAVQRLWEANLFIDDSTDMSALEMRAKCRRLRAEHGLDLVIVDYLQLMRGSGGRNDNRNEEITSIARGLKSLARELRVPVIALSQLSRAVERREDKRPMLSDLRECLTGDARLYCAETGRLKPIRDVRPGDRVLALSRDQKMVPATVSEVWEKGVKPVFRVTTETGRVLTGTANHPFLTQRGYVPLGELGSGDLIATPHSLPAHGAEQPERADLCRFLGYMAGDGHYGKHRTVSFISSERAVYDDAKAIVAAHFPEVAFHEETTGENKTCWEVDFVFHHKDGRHGRPFGNPLLNWIRDLGILGQLCQNKRVPDFVFEAGVVGAREYLTGYLATDGCVKSRVVGGDRRFFVHFDTVSHELSRDVQHLLLRLGVVATVQEPQRKDGIFRPIYRVNINPQSENLRRFAEQVQPVGKKGELLRDFLETPPRVATNPGVFALPAELSALLFERTKDRRQQGRKLPEGKRLYWKNQGKRIRRDTCRAWAARLADPELRTWADSDVLWEQVRNIEPAGEAETFDICVPETGNFVAEGVVVHNSGSIEAEADIVMFIYRPAYYERKQMVSQDGEDKKEEGEAASAEYGGGEEAEVIIAKQRNGPTGTVKLAFMPKYARFDNLAEQREDNPF
jgi:replicative DNA helicase